MACRAEADAKALVDGIAQAVWETDARGIVVSDSPAWRRHTGQSLADLLDRGWVEAIHPAERRDVRRRWRAAVARGYSLAIEARLQGKEGGYRWSHLYLVPLYADDGRIRNWRSEEHTSELQSLMRISYAVFCLKKNTKIKIDIVYTLHSHRLTTST